MAITVLARLLIGWLCDVIGPRRSYTWLVAASSLLALLVRFAAADEQTARRELEARLADDFALAAAGD